MTEKEIEGIICLLEKSLDDDQRIIFQQQIRQMLRGAGRPHGDVQFEKTVLQRWIIHRVLSLGCTKQRFGAFDARLQSSGREAYKPERIGKKYQWIALHEFYARLSDNYEFSAEAIWAPPKERQKD